MGDMAKIDLVEEITPEVIQEAQAQLDSDQTDQNLHYIVLADKNEQPLLRIDPEDEIFVGHFRDDRASYFALGLQRRSFKRVTGYVKFSDEYAKNGGEFLLPESVMGEVDCNCFEILSRKGRVVRIISENEKKKHVGRNAHGRREKLWENEYQESIPMKATTCEYADVPEMNTEGVADCIIRWLEMPWVTDIVANMLSSDMMKHTGSYLAAKRGNEVTDHALGRVKAKVDSLRDAFCDQVEENARRQGKESLVGSWRQRDFEAWLADVAAQDQAFADECQQLALAVPVLVVTADHGASETGLKATQSESNTSHSANRIPYIIYDPLRTSKITLKEEMTIRNNAATLLHLLGFREDIPKIYETSMLPDDFVGSPRRLVEIVLDGWGINEDDPNDPFDAIRTAHTPNYDWLVEHASMTIIKAHGEVIGLRKVLSKREGPHHDRGLQPGATDIGHLHLFSGRLIKQPILCIDELIKGGVHAGLFDAEAEYIRPIVAKMKRVIAENRRFHHIAFGSEGGVHACLSHLYAMMRLAKSLGMRPEQFVIHFIAEGRDVLIPRSAHMFLADLLEEIEKTQIGVVATVFGRADWVRKDKCEHQTDRAVSALAGDLEPFHR